MSSGGSRPPIVLIHGLWLTPRSWEQWVERFEGRGYEVHAPAWPRMHGEVEEIRRDPSPLNGLGLTEIVDRYSEFVRGGLVTELVLDRGLGAAGVALSPAPVKGVLRLPIAQLRAAFPALKNPANRGRTVELTPKQFHYAFTNTMNPVDAKAAYERYQVPGPARPLFQSAVANFNPRAPTKIDFHNDHRPPLLIVGAGQDHTVPASVSNEAAKRLGKSRSIVEYATYPGRPHFTAGAPGWEEVADHSLDWATRHVGAAT
jgi:alpha-beta hydrolase superfamily lysophospholipase